MKRTIIIWILAFAVIATGLAIQYYPFNGKPSLGLTDVDVRETSLNNHRYVIACMRGTNKGGVSIIHSESCPCKARRK